MWNGNFGRIGMFLLPVLAALGGCDSRAAPVQESANSQQQVDMRGDRHRVDPARSRVWVLTENGVVLYRNDRRERVAINLPGWLLIGAAYSCPPDLALGPKGEAIVTSNVVPMLWRIDPDTLEVSVHRLELDSDTDKDLGFSGLSYSSRHGKYFAVSSTHGSVWSVDSLLTKAQKVQTSIAGACGAIS